MTARGLLGTAAVALVVAAALAAAVLLLSRDATEGVLSPQELTDQAARGDLDQDTPTLAERLNTDERTPLPDEQLAGFDGGPPRAVSDYSGTPLVLNFWASWCPPCVEEMPDLNRLAQAAGDDLGVLGVNREDDPTSAAALASELGVSYDLAVDEDDSLFTAVEAFGMPTTLFVDADGTIVHRRTGALTAEEFTAAVAEHLGVDLS